MRHTKFSGLMALPVRSLPARTATGGLGADVAIEGVGLPATFELAADLVVLGRTR